MHVARLLRRLRRWSGVLLVLAGSLSVLLILPRDTYLQDFLPETDKLLKKPLFGLSHSRKSDAERSAFSVVTEGSLGSWVQHLCPHYHAEEGEAKGHERIKFDAPTEDTIFFTQTSCRTTLSPREVRE